VFAQESGIQFINQSKNMIKNKLAIVIPLFLIMILSACSFKSKNYDDNKEKANKESYIIKYALNREPLIA